MLDGNHAKRLTEPKTPDPSIFCLAFSEELLKRRIARNPKALARIGIAKARIQSVLDRETVAHERTLEQKIAEQGPVTQRVDPQLISLAVDDLIALNRLAVHHHPATKQTPWYANIGTKAEVVDERLQTLAPLYMEVSGTLSNEIGDAPHESPHFLKDSRWPNFAARS